MKYIVYVITLLASISLHAIEVTIVGEPKLDTPIILQYGIEEAYLNDTKVIVMTEGMYASITNKLNMLTQMATHQYEADMLTLPGIEKWHGKKQRTIVTNNTVYIEFADGFLYEDRDGKLDHGIKSKFRENKRSRNIDKRPMPRTPPPKPVRSARSISRINRVKSGQSKDVDEIKDKRDSAVVTTNNVTVTYGPGRKVK